MPEDDSDELQLLDESDAKWVKLWKIMAKRGSESSDITYVVLPMNEQKQKSK